VLTSGGATRHDNPTPPAGERSVGDVEVARFIVALSEVGQRRTQPCRDTRHAPRIPQFRLATHKELIPGKPGKLCPNWTENSRLAVTPAVAGSPSAPSMAPGELENELARPSVDSHYDVVGLYYRVRALSLL